MRIENENAGDEAEEVAIGDGYQFSDGTLDPPDSPIPKRVAHTVIGTREEIERLERECPGLATDLEVKTTVVQ